MNIQEIISEKTDVLNPSVGMTNITSILCDMMQANVDYVAKNGLTEPARKSRVHLLELLNITETFNQVSMSNAALKTANHHLFLENAKLKHQLKQIEDETNMANSI